MFLQDLLGASPLHYACIAGHADVCELLCRRVALKGVHVDKLVPQHANRGLTDASRAYTPKNFLLHLFFFVSLPIFCAALHVLRRMHLRTRHPPLFVHSQAATLDFRRSMLILHSGVL